ncbi:MAG: hypothetical protein MUD12_04425 [Spirochaetes bacterium]|jgi:hypothetical protein|nr:hypothetical protein [Spirochaetota bacterium]
MQPNLDNLKKKINENRDFIDKITSKLPGFQGYVEKDELYRADKIIRGFITDAIQKYKNEVNNLSGSMFRGGMMKSLSGLEMVNNNLERVLKKCEYADFGSSSSASGIKIGDEDRNRLLEYDWRLITSAEQLKENLDKLASAKEEEVEGLANEFIAKIREFEKSFDDRKNIIMEVI